MERNVKVVNNVKYFPVSEGLVFGLESMREKMLTRIECEYENYSDEQIDEFSAMVEECEELLDKARTGYVRGRYYARIKEIAEKREWMRYCKCLANGMSEKEAGYALG